MKWYGVLLLYTICMRVTGMGDVWKSVKHSAVPVYHKANVYYKLPKDPDIQKESLELIYVLFVKI